MLVQYLYGNWTRHEMGNRSVKKQYNNETLFLRPSAPHSPSLARPSASSSPVESPLSSKEPSSRRSEVRHYSPFVLCCSGRLFRVLSNSRGFVSVELLGRAVLLYGLSWVLVALEKGGILYDPHGCVLGSSGIRFRNLGWLWRSLQGIVMFPWLSLRKFLQFLCDLDIGKWRENAVRRRLTCDGESKNLESCNTGGELGLVETKKILFLEHFALPFPVG